MRGRLLLLTVLLPAVLLALALADYGTPWP